MSTKYFDLWTDDEIDETIKQNGWLDRKNNEQLFDEIVKSTASFKLAMAVNDRLIKLQRQPVVVDVSKMSSVYSGINGRCCCGCSGKHTYASVHRVNAGKNRGYEVKDEEINDRTVKRIVNLINKTELKEHAYDDMVAVVIKKRLYIAYMRTEDRCEKYASVKTKSPDIT